MTPANVVTLALFALVTGALVAAQAVRGRRGTPAASRACPRCGARIAEGREWCPSCRAPLQAFELVTAKAATSVDAAAGPAHAIVRTDACVGCGTCVDACPEPGALRLVHHIATVDLAACRGHGACAAACPVGAISLATGTSGRIVEAPDLTPDFESRDVPGVYVVGELGGRGLIKNAVNEGRLAMEHVAQALGRTRGPSPADGGVVDVAIVGAGPAGISAGLEAIHQGLRYAVLEQGTIADTIAKYPRSKLLFAEPLRVPMYGDLWIADGSKEELLRVWQAMIEQTGLAVRTHTRVESIAREPGGFRLACGGTDVRARRVVLAMGRRGTPRRLGVPGEDLDTVLYDIIEMEEFRGRRLLVVGGGDSAVESAIGLANQPGTRVTLSYRGDAFTRLKQRNRDKLDTALAAGRLAVLLGSHVREIRRGQAVLEHDGGPRLVPADYVIVRIGGDAPLPFLERLGVRIVRKELAAQPAVEGAAGA